MHAGRVYWSELGTHCNARTSLSLSPVNSNLITGKEQNQSAPQTIGALCTTRRVRPELQMGCCQSSASEPAPSDFRGNLIRKAEKD